MSSITGPMPVAGAKQLTPKSVTLEQIKDILPNRNLNLDPRKLGPSEAERAAGRAKQDATEAHTVYRVDGKIVAVHYRGGIGGTFVSGSDGGEGRGAYDIATAQGLSGEERDNFIANYIAQRLQKRYGAALQVEHYEPGSAPTRGALEAEMFGPRPTQSSPAFTSARVAYSPDTLALLGDN